jgi:hypothetical protein
MIPIDEISQLSVNVIDDLLAIINAKKTLLYASVIYRNGIGKHCETEKIDEELELGNTIRLRFDCDDLAWSSLWQQCHAMAGQNTSVDSISCFISPAGGKSPLHYDKTSVLIIQLSGVKHIGIQRDCANSKPDSDLLIVDQTAQIDLWHTLTAGNVVMIPSGHIHLTKTERQSITLGVGFVRL